MQCRFVRCPAAPHKYAGSALKLGSPSWSATLATYGVLLGLVYVASLDFDEARQSWVYLQDRTRNILSAHAVHK